MRGPRLELILINVDLIASSCASSTSSVTNFAQETGHPANLTIEPACTPVAWSLWPSTFSQLSETNFVSLLLGAETQGLRD